MSSINVIPADKLARLIGTPKCPALLDVRTLEDLAADPRLVPSAVHREFDSAEEWAPTYRDRSVIVLCNEGHALSHGVAARLRHDGADAEVLEGGIQAWRNVGLPLISTASLPPRDAQGRTRWVTRERPKIDRIACPWLIRRFVDPDAVFLFVAPPEVRSVAERFGAAPFDIEDVFWSHRGAFCTFDTMLQEFGLETEALTLLAQIVRAADTGHPELAPEAPGLLAASLGLSRMYADDLEQLDAGLQLYDAFYRWCRDAAQETHNWPTNRPATAR